MYQNSQSNLIGFGADVKIKGRLRATIFKSAEAVHLIVHTDSTKINRPFWAQKVPKEA